MRDFPSGHVYIEALKSAVPGMPGVGQGGDAEDLPGDEVAE